MLVNFQDYLLKEVKHIYQQVSKSLTGVSNVSFAPCLTRLASRTASIVSSAVSISLPYFLGEILGVDRKDIPEEWTVGDMDNIYGILIIIAIIVKGSIENLSFLFDTLVSTLSTML